MRFYVQDTDSTDQLLTDEEIAFLLSTYGDALSSAIAALEALAAKYARQVDTSVDRVSEAASQRAERYAALADSLKTRQVTFALPTFGGVSQADKDTIEADTDVVQPAIRRDQFNPPETESL